MPSLFLLEKHMFDTPTRDDWCKATPANPKLITANKRWNEAKFPAQEGGGEDGCKKIINGWFCLPQLVRRFLHWKYHNKEKWYSKQAYKKRMLRKDHGGTFLQMQTDIYCFSYTLLTRSTHSTLYEAKDKDFITLASTRIKLMYSSMLQFTFTFLSLHRGTLTLESLQYVRCLSHEPRLVALAPMSLL